MGPAQVTNISVLILVCDCLEMMAVVQTAVISSKSSRICSKNSDDTKKIKVRRKRKPKKNSEKKCSELNPKSDGRFETIVRNKPSKPKRLIVPNELDFM